MDEFQCKLENVLGKFSPESSNLIPLLQETQKIEGYLSPPIIMRIAEHLKMTEAQVYGVASFYSQFRFVPRGRHSITVCLGTACHVKGGEVLLDTLCRELEIEPGQCTIDKRFDLNRVACLGCCALAPVILVDTDIYSNVTVIKIKEILEKYE
jgi:NADH-quinone oxidoreductase subunit E